MTNLKRLQIDELNSRVKVRIGPSKIAGVGLIAMRDIDKDEKLYADYTPVVYSLTFSDMKKLRKEIREMLLEQWPLITQGSKFAFPTSRLQAFCNHSEQPNYDAKNDTMIEDVKEGDEITENYRLIPGYQQVFPWLAK